MDNPQRIHPQDASRENHQNLDPYDAEEQAQLRPHSEWADQIMALAQQRLSDEERAAVERHLETCERCAAAYHACRQVARLLRLAAPRKRAIRRRSAAYSSLILTKPSLPVLTMPPGLPPQMQAYQERYVASPDQPPPQPPNVVPIKAPET